MRRVLGLVDLVVIAAASMGPAFSLATTFGPMVAAGGSGTPLALVLVTAIMACVAAGYQRLGERYPNAGSSYTWVRIAFGRRAGAYAAWVLIVANIFAVVATAVPAGTYSLSLLAPAFAVFPMAGALVGAVWVLGAGALLYAGLRPTAYVTNVLLFAELLVLAVLAIASLVHPAVRNAAIGAAAPTPVALIGAVVIGIWLTDGWEVSASTAEESEGSPAVPGVGGLGGLFVSAAILWVCMAAFLRIGPLAGFIAHEGDALAYVGEQLGGRLWGIAISLTVLVSLAASLQTTLIYLTRSFFAMGRDGVLPSAFGRLDRRRQPAFAIAAMTLAGTAFVLVSGFSRTLQAAFAFILSGASVFLGVLFLMSAAAAVRLFAHDPRVRLTGVVLPGAAVIALAILLGTTVVQSDPPTRAFLLAAAFVGIPLAWWRGRASAPAI
ncbi:MAG: amino acid permease [Candidatus Velthaea sp.]